MVHKDLTRLDHATGITGRALEGRNGVREELCYRERLPKNNQHIEMSIVIKGTD